jgi:hypothetical protein
MDFRDPNPPDRPERFVPGTPRRPYISRRRREEMDGHFFCSKPAWWKVLRAASIVAGRLVTLVVLVALVAAPIALVFLVGFQLVQTETGRFVSPLLLLAGIALVLIVSQVWRDPPYLP